MVLGGFIHLPKIQLNVLTEKLAASANSEFALITCQICKLINLEQLCESRCLKYLCSRIFVKKETAMLSRKEGCSSDAARSQNMTTVRP